MTPLEAQLTAALGDRYEIGERLGAGGMATVYRARDRKHGRDVAIKVLRPELAATLTAERFLREIRIAARLHHPHILQLFDSDEAGGLLYYIMPLARGETLRTRLSRDRSLPLAEANRLLAQVADALDYAHREGVVHRDIKPENILLESGHALVADFGVARAVSGAREAEGPDTLTDAGILVGTPSYMSPEQIDGAGELDGRTDQYALACVWFEMMTGRPPYLGASYSAVLRQHVMGETPSVRQARPELPDYTDPVLRKAMAKSPEDRYPTAGDFVRALRGESPPPSQPAPQVRRRRAPVLAAAAIGLAALAVAVILLWGRFRQEVPLSDNAVVVLPFSAGQGDSLGLGAGMVTLLSTKLDGAGELRTVDPRAMMSYLGRQRSADLGAAEARDVARHFQAGLYILGDVLDIGGRVTLSAGLYDVRRSEPIVRASRTGSTSEVFELVDGLASELLTGWGGGQSGVTRISAVTTHSLPALKAYLEGESELRVGRFDRALQAFVQAGLADTTFALAWYRQSVAAEWLTQAETAREAADRALRLADRLPDRERQLLQAIVLGRHGDPAGAERIYQVLLGSHPDDLEAWIQLAELQFHNTAWRGMGPVSVSRPAFERVLFYDPENVAAMVHLARIAASEGRHQELDSLVSRIQSLHQRAGGGSGAEARSELLEIKALRAYTLRDQAAQESVLRRLQTASDVTAVLTTWDVTGFSGNPDGALRTARIGTAPSRAPRVRAVNFAMLAHIQAGMGRLRDARASLDSVAVLDPRLGTFYRAYLETLPFVSAPPDTLADLLRRLRRMPVDTLASRPRADVSTYFRESRGSDRHIQLYLLGLLHSALGEQEAAERMAGEVARLNGPMEYPALAHDLATGIRADIAWRRGDLETVQRLVKTIRMDLWYQDALTTPFYDAARERYLGAIADDELGRAEAALLMLDGFGQVSPYDNAFTGPALARRAAVLERLGRRDEAGRYYRRSAELLSGADPEVQATLRLVRGSEGSAPAEEPERQGPVIRTRQEP